jgi:flagellar biosynthesis protein
MKEEKAVALKYDKNGEAAPKVVAKGQGEIAQKIKQKAEEFDIPIFQNEALAASLLNLNLDEQIPPNLYKAVAEVFVWLMQSEKKAAESK